MPESPLQRPPAAPKGSRFSTIVAVMILMFGVGFLLLTAPIAAHQIARAGYLSRVPLEDSTVVDELRGRYDTSTQALASS